MGAVDTPAPYVGCPATVTDALAAGRQLRAPRWGLRDVLVAFLAQALAVAVVGGALTWAGAGLAAVVIAGTLAGWAGLLGWTVLATSRRGNGPRIDLGIRLTAADARAGALAGVLVLVAGLVVGAITMAVTGEFSSAAGDALTAMLAEQDTAAVLAFMLMVAVLAPVVEEAYVRGLMFAALRKRGLSAGWTVGLTTIAFAVMHFEPVRLPMILAMGAVLGIVRARTGSAGAAMVAHGVNNSLQVIAVLAVLAG